MPPPLLLFSLLSGLTSLVYEVTWAKGLSLLLGGTALAQTTVLASFLGGLSAGSYWLGRRADSETDPLAFYGRLELAIGLLGLVSPWSLSALEALLGALADASAGPWVFSAAGTLGGALLVGLPAAAIGGVLPALCRAHQSELRVGLPRLYSSNCAGAVAGSLAAGFLLIPAAGLDWTLRATALIDLGLGCAALKLARGAGPAPRPAKAAPPAAEPFPLEIAAGAAYLCGAATLAYEVSWIRILSLVMGSSTYSFSIMLAAFIAGIGLGGWLVGTRLLKGREPWTALAVVQLGAAAAIGLSLPHYEKLPYLFVILKGKVGQGPLSFYAFEAVKFFFCVAVMLVPTTLLGASLPLTASLCPEPPGGRGRRIGLLLAASALGNVLGAVSGLVLMPRLGLAGLIRAATLANAATAFLVLAAAPGPGRRRFALAVALALPALTAAWTPRWRPENLNYGVLRVRPDALPDTYAEFRRIWTGDLQLLFARDDQTATVSVFLHPTGGRTMQINGKTDASSGRDMRTQVLIAQIPLLLKTDITEALVIGWGSGVTAGSMLTHPIERLDAVEISPAVVEGSAHFAQENRHALDDPRLRLHLEDAKAYLRRSRDRYGLILSEPSNPWMAGVGNLFTAEFYRQAKAALKPGGLMVQWFHGYEMDDETMRLILRTFASEFPHATLWQLLNRDIVMIGSPDPIEPDFKLSERRLLRPEVWSSLQSANILSLSTLLATQTMGDQTLRELAGAGPLNLDRFPRLEYRAPKAFFRRNVAKVLESRDDRADPSRKGELMLERYLATRGRPLDNREFMDVLSDALAQDGGAAYLLWAREWAQRHPREKLALYTLYVQELAAGRKQEALKAIRRASALAPTDSNLRRIRGELEKTLGG